MKIAITGNSCVGKSTLVRQLARVLDVKVFDVDAWTADQYKYNTEFQLFLRTTFGTIDKLKIRQELHKHPHKIGQTQHALKEPFEEAVYHFLQTHNSGIIDMAQLFEACDVDDLLGDMIIINVTADQDTRQLMADARSVSVYDLELFDSRQFYPELKSVLSDYTIHNTYNVTPTHDANAIAPLLAILQQVEECTDILAPNMCTDWRFKFPDTVEAFQSLVFRIICRYEKNNMAYHNFGHIMYMLRSYVNHGMYGMSNGGLELILAILIHDIDYNPKSTTNEEDSARVALELIRRYMPTVNTRQRREVADLILSTKLSINSDGFKNDAYFLKDVIHDLDFAVFAGTEVVAYDKAISEEYAHVSRPTYLAKRIEVLESFLAQPIYRTPSGKRWEDDARANIQFLINTNKMWLASCEECL